MLEGGGSTPACGVNEYADPFVFSDYVVIISSQLEVFPAFLCTIVPHHPGHTYNSDKQGFLTQY
jgi:hypothetical protein